jgi:tetratricopeptide (TPR) repeat protein
MSIQDAATLFQQKLSQPVADDEAKRVTSLVVALEQMPLAIVQAAAYILHRWPRCSVQQYLDDYQASDRKRAGLLSYEGGKLRRDGSAKNSILITWQISFDHIQQARPSAADMLSLMSFCDRQGIPEILLHDQDPTARLLSQEAKIYSLEEGESEEYANYRGNDDFSSLQSDKSDSHTFEDDILVLRNYSFIYANEDGRSFEMHRLVQLATQEWLEHHEKKEHWRHRFLAKLCREMPTGEYENWALCRAIFPHARWAAMKMPKGRDSVADWATVLYQAAWYCLETGDGGEAERLSVLAMKARKRIFEADDEAVLWAMSMLSLAYRLNGRWEEAETLQVQVMESRMMKLGEDHTLTLTSMADLASTLWIQGRWEEAEKLEVQVVKAFKMKLGEDHPNTLASMGNLASTYREQGRWEEAEKLEVQVVKAFKMKLGEDHPDTLASMGNLAATYRKQGRWEEAETRQAQVVERSRKKLGEDHPDTLTIMADLASTYRDQGLWEEAEKLGVQVMERSKATLGEDHPDMLNSMGNLASTYRDQGLWEEAEMLEVQVMERSKATLGEDHPDTLNSMANLASTLWNQGRLEEAEMLEVQVMEERKVKLGEDHPDTLTSMANLACTYWSQDRFAEAVYLMRRCVEAQKAKLGAEHPAYQNNDIILTQWVSGVDIAETGDVRSLDQVGYTV